MAMRALLLTPTLFFLWSLGAMAQQDIEDVIVEVYYVSDANDATDAIGGTLAPGSRTYRIYIDLCDSCALRSLFGNANHTLAFQSTAPFFNNMDRGRTYGHLINNGALDENTAALDSWLTLGAASNTRMGVLKEEDPDGSFVGGTNNDGGSAAIPGGLLVNADPDAGIPLTAQDGLTPLPSGSSVVPPNFNVLGEEPTTPFGTTTESGVFLTNDLRVGSSAPGVRGPTASNRVLVAQVTTTGELSFALNVEVQRPDGSLISYVASDSLLQPGEIPNGLLRFPPECGCTDPNFLEYDPAAGCDDGSCATTIVFGCLDTLACNYDPLANFNVQQLCCFGPEDCNGLDVQVVCPGVGINEASRMADVVIYPNPTTGYLDLRTSNVPLGPVEVRVIDVLGRTVWDGQVIIGGQLTTLDLSILPSATYHVLWRGRGWHARSTIIKL